MLPTPDSKRLHFRTCFLQELVTLLQARVPGRGHTHSTRTKSHYCVELVRWQSVDLSFLRFLNQIPGESGRSPNGKLFFGVSVLSLALQVEMYGLSPRKTSHQSGHYVLLGLFSLSSTHLTHL